MKITEHTFSDRRVALALYDGHRLVAKARPVYATGTYLVTARGLCLLDKKPHPNMKNRLGTSNPQMMEVKNLREARRIIQGLVKSVTTHQPRRR